MSILRNLKLIRLNLVILISTVSLITFSSLVWGDDWVKIGSDEVFTQYYNSSILKYSGKKKLELKKINDEWKISREIM